MRVLEIELRNAGYSGRPADFRALLAREYDAFMRHHAPAMPVGEFLLRPSLALAFVDRVHAALKTSRLTEHVVLALLVKAKKTKSNNGVRP
jgi:hypothetical protein